MRTTVEIPRHRDTRWKAWAKHLTGVDTSKSNGYAFEGNWLHLGEKAELEVGSYILWYHVEGSHKYRRPNVSVLQVQADGSLQSVIETAGWSWALDIRDQVAQLFSSGEEEILQKKIAVLEEELQKLRMQLEEVRKKKNETTT